VVDTALFGEIKHGVQIVRFGLIHRVSAIHEIPAILADHVNELSAFATDLRRRSSEQSTYGKVSATFVAKPKSPFLS
jgi:hypothetical protein